VVEIEVHGRIGKLRETRGRTQDTVDSTTVYRTIQIVLGGLLVGLFGLSALARRFAQVSWLQVFRFERPQLNEAQRARIRQRANVHAGIELILLGIVVPIVYVALTVMFFNSVTSSAIILVAGASILLIGLGVTAIWRNRR
jgi:hypothetical protein